MSDNTILPGSGESIRDLDRSGVKTQIVGLDLNPGGSESLMAGAMPVTDNGTSLTTDGAYASSNVTWTSATADETTLSADVRGYGSVAFGFVCDAGTFTDGSITMEGSNNGGTNWVTVIGVQPGSQTSQLSSFTLSASLNRVYQLSVGALTHIRARLSDAIVGTGSLTVTLTAAQQPVTTSAAIAATVTQSNATLLQTTAQANITGGNVAHDSPGTSLNPVAVGAYARSTAPTDVSTDTDVVRLWALRNGALATNLTAAGALIGGDATNGLDVDVTRLPELPAGDQNIGNVDVVTVPAPLSTTGGGTEATALRVTLATDSTGLVSVDDNAGSLTVDAPVGTPVFVRLSDGASAITTLPVSLASAPSTPVTNAGTFAVQAAGDVAHDAGDSGNPVKIGYKAANALPTAVANNDRANGVSDLWGRQLVAHIDPAMFVSKSFNATTQQTGTDVWTPTSGKKIAVTSVVIGVYGTTAGRIILWFGDNADTTYTAGTDQVLLAFSAAPSASSKPGLVFTPASPIFCTTADRELHITTDAALSIDVTVHGYEW